MKADSELKVKLVAEYDGSGAKQAARSAEDTAETVSKANAQIEESAARAGRATEETTNRLREQKQAAKENAEEATNAGTAAEAAMNKTKAGAEGAGAAVGALPGMFSAAGKAARVFQTAAGWFFGWLALANQVIELFKKIYEWWNKKPGEEAAKKREELLRKQREEAEKLNAALDAIARKRHDEALADLRLRNEKAITAEYEKRAELAERAATAQDRAQMLRDERTGNLQNAARTRLDIMLMSGQITDEQHKEAIYQLEKAAEANTVATRRADATKAVSDAESRKRAASDDLSAARAAVSETEWRLGDYSRISEYDTRAKIAADARGQYDAARGKRDEAVEAFKRKLISYYESATSSKGLPPQFANIDWSSENLAGVLEESLRKWERNLQIMLGKDHPIPSRRMARLRYELLPLIAGQEDIMHRTDTTAREAQRPLDELAKRLAAAGYNVSSPEHLRAAVNAEITNLGAQRTREGEARSVYFDALDGLKTAWADFSTTFAETSETLSARTAADIAHSDEMNSLAAARESEAAFERKQRQLTTDLERQQQAADAAAERAAFERRSADEAMQKVRDRDISGARDQSAATLRRDAATNLLTLAQDDPAMLRKILRMTDPNRDAETDPVELSDKQRQRYGTALRLAGRGSTMAEREDIHDAARALLQAMAAEKDAVTASGHVQFTQTMLDMHQKQPAAEQYARGQHAAGAASDAAAGKLPPAVQEVINGMRADTERANADAAAAAQALNNAGALIEKQSAAIVNLQHKIIELGQRVSRAEQLTKNQPLRTA